MTLDPARLAYTKGGGVVTVVAQDAHTGRVLMVAAADREAVERTIATPTRCWRGLLRPVRHVMPAPSPASGGPQIRVTCSWSSIASSQPARSSRG